MAALTFDDLATDDDAGKASRALKFDDLAPVDQVAERRKARGLPVRAELESEMQAERGSMANRFDRFSEGVIEHTEGLTRAFSNPIRAVEEGIESAAISSGLAEPGSKLLISPDREIGRAFNRAGELTSGAVEDVASLMAGEPERLGGNVMAAARGEPRPLQEEIKDVDGWRKFTADVSTAISHTAPQLLSMSTMVKGGISAPVAGASSFGFTPEGFDPKTALVMAAFPGVAEVGSEMALKIVGERLATDTARAVAANIGSFSAAQAYMDLTSLPDYARMTPEEAKAAWTKNFAINLAFHAGTLPGLTKEAVNEIKSGRNFDKVLNESAQKIAAQLGDPKLAQVEATPLQQKYFPHSIDALRKAAEGRGPTPPRPSQDPLKTDADPINEPAFARAEEVAAMPPDQFMAETQTGGRFYPYTLPAYAIGRAVTTPEQLQRLLNLRDQFAAEARQIKAEGDALPDVADRIQKVQSAQPLDAKAQFFNEAYAAATGTSGAGQYLRRDDPGYKPPFPLADVTGLINPATHPVVKVPVKDLVVSKDVPSFKAEADAETGVVEPLAGPFNEMAGGAITVWERADGTKEVISGRHRLELAQREGIENINAQVVREADGFTKDNALTLDAEHNIIEGQGTLEDYVRYFRNTPELTPEEAGYRGLRSSPQSQKAWDFAKNAGDDLYALYTGKKITEAQAVAIAEAYPGDAAAQAAAVKALETKAPAAEPAEPAPASAPTASDDEIVVDPSRFDIGAFGEKEGDIAKSYSAQKPDKPATFTHEGRLYTKLGGVGNFYSDTATAHELIPAAEYKGPPQTGRAYEGRAVTHKKKPYRLGPPVKFVSRPTDAQLVQKLRNMYAHGGHFASQAGHYHGMLTKFLERDLPENVQRVLEAELARPDVPSQAAMRSELGGAPLTYSALWLPTPGNVVFYENGEQIGVLRWSDKEPFKVTGTRTHPKLQQVVDAYLKDRLEPSDAKDIKLPEAPPAAPPSDQPNLIEPSGEPSPVPPAVEAEVSTPEPAKQKADFDPAAARAQKKFLLDELGKALAEAPALSSLPSPTRALFDEVAQIETDFSKANDSAKQKELQNRLKAKREEIKAAVGTVTIEIPGDGTFEILNTREALTKFKERAEKFPITAGKYVEKRLPSAKAASPSALVKKVDRPAILKAAADYISEDDKRPAVQVIWSDGEQTVATDGRRLLQVKQGIGPKGAGKVYTAEGKEITDEKQPAFPNWRQVIPSEESRVLIAKDFDAARLFTITRQAQGVLAAEDYYNPVTLLLNKDKSLGLRARGRNGDIYEHNIQPDALPLAAVDVRYLADVANTARKLGDEKLDIFVTTTEINDRQLTGMTPFMFSGKNWQVTIMPMRGDNSPRSDVEQFLGIKPKPGKSKKPKPPEPPLEERIGGRTAEQDPFAMDDADLADLFNERFGDTGASEGDLTAGRAGTYTFPDYDAFKNWMDARYVERDLEGMKLAFAEAPTPNKVRYLKEHRTADPHKKAWVAHLATGAVLPLESPPVPRTTPRPGPTGAPIPVPTPPPPGRPAPPPPPPRAPTPHRKFDAMALTQLFRQFSRFPVINARLMRAYGQFDPNTSAVELKERLFWDTKLAERVLGHEIGHFIDLIVERRGHGLPFAQRLAPLRDFKTKAYEMRDLRAEAKSLSRQWRGNFPDGDRYRDTAVELFADTMSAIFNKPEWVNQNYPKLHDAFQELLAGKPAFRAAYEEMTRWLTGDTMTDQWISQQRAAARRTVDDLLTERPRHRESFRDWLKGAFISVWHRAYGKENRPARLGTSITDELEYSHSWAAKENALFADDFKKLVEPPLARVNPNALEARSLLHAYSQARRTIGERRAAGLWIETHPIEARELLTHLLDIDATLHSKFRGQLDSASDDQLYDLSGAIFREIHDRGERFVDRMAREIDGLELGVGGETALHAFNVRGKLLNPGGLTEANAQKVIDKLRDQLTPEQFTALDEAASALRDLFYNTQEQAFREGLISAKTWNELIEPNRDNYVPYAVLDYWDGKVRGGVMPQKGTAKDIADVTLAAQLKAGSLNAWRQRQRQAQLLRDAYRAGGQVVPVGQRLRRASDIEHIRTQHPNDDISRAVLWRDGRPHLLEFPGDPGKTFEKAMDSSSFYEHMQWVAEAGNITHGIMQLYTTLSIPFLVYRNPVRGARTSALRTGFARTGQQLLTPAQLRENARLAKNYAEAAFGGEMLPEIRELVDRQVLLPPRLSSAMVRDPANLRELLESGGILATQIRSLHGAQWPWWKGGRPGRAAYEFAEKVFTGYEAFEKIYNYQAALARGLTPAQATALGRRAGIPKPGVGGHLTLPMEVFFPWTRVHLQGARSTIDMLRDPVLRKGFITRFALTEALPRLMKIAVGAGVIAGTVSWLTGRKDEEKDDPVMGEVFRRVSPYKMAIDDIIPLMLYDSREGKYHYFNDFKSGKSIPSHYEVVSWRIPASEEGRLWGTLLYDLMSSAPGAKEKLARAGADPLSATGDWAKNNLAPGFSPALETSGALYEMILRGKNPEDPFRGQPAANKQLFDAGGVDRAQAIAGYTMNQLGGPGELAAVLAMNFGLLDERAAGALKRRLAGDKTPLPERLPLARNMFSYDNYATYRDEKSASLAEDRLRAQSRLLMSDDVRKMYDFYYRNQARAKKLEGLDLQRYRLSSVFVHRVWGNLGSVDDEGVPRSFYAKAAHAISKDGSRMARETLRRDLDEAAAPLLARWDVLE